MLAKCDSKVIASAPFFVECLKGYRRKLLSQIKKNRRTHFKIKNLQSRYQELNELSIFQPTLIFLLFLCINSNLCWHNEFCVFDMQRRYFHFALTFYFLYLAITYKKMIVSHAHTHPPLANRLLLLKARYSPHSNRRSFQWSRLFFMIEIPKINVYFEISAVL